MEFTYAGGVEGIARALADMLAEDMERHFNRELYESHALKIAPHQYREQQTETVSPRQAHNGIGQVRNTELSGQTVLRQHGNEEIAQENLATERGGIGREQKTELSGQTVRQQTRQAAPSMVQPSETTVGIFDDEPPYPPDLDPFWQVIEDHWFPDEVEASIRTEEALRAERRQAEPSSAQTTLFPDVPASPHPSRQTAEFRQPATSVPLPETARRGGRAEPERYCRKCFPTCGRKRNGIRPAGCRNPHLSMSSRGRSGTLPRRSGATLTGGWKNGMPLRRPPPTATGSTPKRER